MIAAPSGSFGDIQTLAGSRTPHGLSGDHHNRAAERGCNPAALPEAHQHAQGNRLERDGRPLHRPGNTAVGVEQLTDKSFPLVLKPWAIFAFAAVIKF